jgi:hypothetical protein
MDGSKTPTRRNLHPTCPNTVNCTTNVTFPRTKANREQTPAVGHARGTAKSLERLAIKWTGQICLF